MAGGGGAAVKLYQLVGSLRKEYIPGEDVMMDPAIWGELPFDILMDAFAFSSFDQQMQAKVLSMGCKRCIESPAFRLQASAHAKPLPAAICAYEVIGGHGGPADLYQDVPEGTVRILFPRWTSPRWANQDMAMQQQPRSSTGKVDNMSLSFLPHDMQSLLTSGFYKHKVQFFGNGLLGIRKYGSQESIVMVNLLNRSWRRLPELKLPETSQDQRLSMFMEVDEITCDVDEGAGTFKVLHFFQWWDNARFAHVWCVGIYASERDSWDVVQGQAYGAPIHSIHNFLNINPHSDPTRPRFVRAFAENRIYTQFNLYSEPGFDYSNAELIVHSLDDGARVKVIHAQWPPLPTLLDMHRAGRWNLTSQLPVEFEEWKGLWYYKGNLYGAVTYSVGGDILLGITMLHPNERSWGPAKLLPHPSWFTGLPARWNGLTYGWDGNIGLAGQYIWVAQYYMKKEEAVHSFLFDPTATQRCTDEIWHDWHTVTLFDIRARCWLEVLSDMRDKKSCKLSLFEHKAVHINL